MTKKFNYHIVSSIFTVIILIFFYALPCNATIIDHNSNDGLIYDDLNSLVWYVDIENYILATSSSDDRNDWYTDLTQALDDDMDVNGDGVLDKLTWRWSLWEEIQALYINNYNPNPFWTNVYQNDYWSVAGLSSTPEFWTVGSVASKEEHQGLDTIAIATSIGTISDDLIKALGTNFTAPIIPLLTADLVLGEPSIIPEPSTMLLFGIGLLGLAGVSRRKK